MFLDMAKRAHKVNRDNGFWDNPRPHRASMVLIATEVAELAEEIRKGTPPVYFEHAGQKVEIDFKAPISAEDFGGEDILIEGQEAKSHMHKPEGEVSELADIIIRCFDAFEGYGLPGLQNAYQIFTGSPYYTEDVNKKLSFIHNIVRCSGAHFMSDSEFANNLNAIIYYTLVYAVSRGLYYRVIEMIDIKITYNSLRGKMHGKLA